MVMLDEGENFRNLLGRDLLVGFNYSFDNDKQVFTISRADAFTHIWDQLRGQEIHAVERLSSESDEFQESNNFWEVFQKV